MALSFTLRCNLQRSALSEERLKMRTSALHLNNNINVLKNQLVSRQFLLKHGSTSPFQHGALSSSSLAADSSQSGLEEHSLLTNDVKFNRVNCLVWLLHESARSFSAAVKSLGLGGAGPPLAMAWIGVDVHAWHKHISYQVAVYALLMAVTEVELFLSHNRSSNPSPVLNILSPKANFLGDLIDSQLNTRDPKLVQWFRMVELPRISGSFMALFKKWTMEYAGSGVAGTAMAMTCCACIQKLGSERISCCLFSDSIGDALFDLMDATNNLVPLDKLHFLATEAGFEEDFLSYFGSKILPHKNVEDVEFWIRLVQRKLCAAFHRESVASNTRILSNEVGENSLATLALFAYLGRETRLFLSRHGIRVLDKQTRDFVSYLECGILFIYPEFSTLSEYQLLMEVIIDEIGWLNFYAAYNNQLRQERRRSKHPPIQAEKEITLHAVFTVCYDVILGYAHCSNSKHQALGADLLNFLLRSQALLSTCLEDYWVAYDGTIEMQKIVEKNDPDMMASSWMKGAKSSYAVDTRYRPTEINKVEKHIQNLATSSSSFQGESENFLDSGHTSKPKAFQRNFLRKYTRDLVAASIDVWMGTQLLFVDISYTMRLVQKKLRGQRVTKRERRKIQRTTSDMFTLIPVAILMLLPVSAVGHAAMFAAIKKYMPNLIPSPYSDERLDLVKQLKRIKKMKVRLIGIEESASKAVKH
ncbi:uncharacterized protein LOC131007750 isoform X2 [Salvia miltiorrhiza]|uniref:uncharacterized protein LOC131007750 isoform X2 n=1 Tax=Salvia miltiorrhiza TaxID=226208 RepID=UPI0025AD8C7D|nr:uncharacterized protein LOC131007750 isoform X2 [Salvia miltiorrhiza]